LHVTAPAIKSFAGLAGVPIGSALKAWPCLLQVKGTPNTLQGVYLEAVQILLPDMASIRILQQPSWWTATFCLTGGHTPGDVSRRSYLVAYDSAEKLRVEVLHR
jgi:hypothetical protein